MQSRGLPGFRDFPPEDLALRTHIFEVWRKVAARYGFEEYDGPPLEPLDLYTGKSGEEIVAQLYAFTDKGDREVALRPEMTPTLARMVAARANGLKKPIRWFSIPQLFRYERQQRGRLREHFQLNCDLIGEAGPLADAEIIALAIDIMRGFGLTQHDIRVRVNDRHYMNSAVAAITQLPELTPVVLLAIDRLEKDREGAEKMLAGKLPPRLVEQVFALVGPAVVAPTPPGPLGETLRRLDEMGLREWVQVDMKIVRGLAYYTGIVFEVFATQGIHRAICGGGRYDTLLGSLGGADLPALGFGMGDVVLGELLKDHGWRAAGEPAIDAFIAGVTSDDVADVLRLAHELRDAGVRVEYALNQGSVGKQLTLANARGARFAIVVGPDDRARGEVQVKDLAAKTQDSIARGSAVDALRARLASSRLTTHDSRLLNG